MKRSAVGMSLVGILVLASCASQTPEQTALPANVSIMRSGTADYVDKVDFSSAVKAGKSFSDLKLCVAETVTSDDVLLSDDAGSFVGPRTGNYYEIETNHVVTGREVIKYVDDGAATLIATGRTSAVSNGLMPITDLINFEIKAALSSDRLTMIFQNVTRAQQSTGYASNPGFGPVGTWNGARAPQVYSALQAVADRIRGCMGEA